MPLGRLKVGSVASNRTGLLIEDPRSEKWERPAWVESERITSFVGQPLIFRDETLGVLAVFRREPINEQEFRWLRMFADQAASAVANARAFSELDRLRQQLESHNAYLKEEVDSALSFGRIVGRSRSLRHVLQQVDDVASSDATVLITGESGTGKELLAREIHERSRRSRQPFVRVNCSAIPREMFESEFFGHVRGAFTGAMRDRPGRFQIANGGTIFLDEIGDLPLELQPKLLRVLQEGEYERVGEDVTRKVDVRVIAATNQNLAEDVRARRFREDLFYRLNVLPLALPPLRARTDDIPLLAAHAIAEVSKRLRIQAPTLTQADAARLQQYDWPGNVRELENVIQRAVILSRGVRLRLDIALADLPAPVTSVPDADRSEVVLTDRECRERERANLMKALHRADGRIYGQGGAAELLGINPTTLASRLRALKITPPKPH
jgi:transcriptional regulator with GAF, ATPase, and Fis domain